MGVHTEWSNRGDTVYAFRYPTALNEASLQSGEVFTEYGVVDLSHHYPVMSYKWQPEFPPKDTPEEHREWDDPQRHNVSECFQTVPFVVVMRGFDSRRSADSWIENQDYPRRYEAVQLRDTRGL